MAAPIAVSNWMTFVDALSRGSLGNYASVILTRENRIWGLWGAEGLLGKAQNTANKLSDLSVVSRFVVIVLGCFIIFNYSKNG